MALQMLMLETIARQAGEFDILHGHLDYVPFGLFSRLDTPHLATLHGRLDLAELGRSTEAFPEISAAGVHFGCPADAVAAAELGRNRAARAAGGPADAAARAAVLPRLPGRIRRRRGRPRHPDRPALRHPAEDRRQGGPGRRGLLRRRDPADARRGRDGDDRRNRGGGKAGLPVGGARAADADRLARAVRPRDDRGDGLRHARDRFRAGRCRRSSRTA